VRIRNKGKGVEKAKKGEKMALVRGKVREKGQIWARMRK